MRGVNIVLKKDYEQLIALGSCEYKKCKYIRWCNGNRKEYPEAWICNKKNKLTEEN